MKLTNSIMMMLTAHMLCIPANIIPFLSPMIRSTEKSSTDKRSITFLPTSPWIEFGLNNKSLITIPGKPTLVGSITLQTNIHQPIILSQLKLNWHGPRIEHLFGSLYKKDPNKAFLAIEQNFICDGIWNKDEQSLLLNFTYKQKITSTKTLGLVLTISPELKETLNAGYFTLDETLLPDIFKTCTRPQQLFLRG